MHYFVYIIFKKPASRWSYWLTGKWQNGEILKMSPYSTGARVWVSAPPPRQRFLSFPQLLGRFWVQIKKIPKNPPLLLPVAAILNFRPLRAWYGKTNFFSMGDSSKIFFSSLGFSYPGNLLKLFLGSWGPKIPPGLKFDPQKAQKGHFLVIF